ncbi:hypothetical protein CYMTET_29509, partial [Cymbomonas tetramitiformis]
NPKLKKACLTVRAAAAAAVPRANPAITSNARLPGQDAGMMSVHSHPAITGMHLQQIQHPFGRNGRTQSAPCFMEDFVINNGMHTPALVQEPELHFSTLNTSSSSSSPPPSSEASGGHNAALNWVPNRDFPDTVSGTGGAAPHSQIPKQPPAGSRGAAPSSKPAAPVPGEGGGDEMEVVKMEVPSMRPVPSDCSMPGMVRAPAEQLESWTSPSPPPNLWGDSPPPEVMTTADWAAVSNDNVEGMGYSDEGSLPRFLDDTELEDSSAELRLLPKHLHHGMTKSESMPDLTLAGKTRLMSRLNSFESSLDYEDDLSGELSVLSSDLAFDENDDEEQSELLGTALPGGLMDLEMVRGMTATPLDDMVKGLFDYVDESSGSGIPAPIAVQPMEQLSVKPEPMDENASGLSHMEAVGEASSLKDSGGSVLEVARASLGSRAQREVALEVSSKRVSRIMANRLSAAKSRVKKLQHTAELENRVKELQNHLAGLRPKVEGMQTQVASQTKENGALKQRLQGAHEQKKVQDHQHEALREELQRLQSRKEGGGCSTDMNDCAQSTRDN